MMSTTEPEAGMSAGRMDGERRLILPGAVSGVAAGLAVALRDVWLISTWASLSHLSVFGREAGTLLFAGTVIGLVLGTLVAAGLPAVNQLLSRLTSDRLRPSLDTLSLIAIAAAAVGLRLLIPRESAHIWLDIGILATVLLAVNPRRGDDRASAVARAVSMGAAIAITSVILFPVLSLVNEVGPALLRMLACLLSAVAVVGANVGVFWLLRSRLDRVARRLGTVIFAALACGIMMLPGVVLGAGYVWFEHVEIDLLLDLMPPNCRCGLCGRF